MSNNYLLKDWQIAKSKLDTANIKRKLAELESTFASARNERAAILADHGPEDNPVKRAELARIKTRTGATIARLKAEIKSSLEAAEAQAEQGKAEAYRVFSQSPEGVAYRSGLAAYAPLVGRLSPDAIAGRINQALAGGLYGDARAWSELADLYVERRTGALAVALNDAKTKALTPVETAANADFATLQNAKEMYGLLAYFADNRLDDIVNRGEDHRDGFYNPDNVFKTDEGGEA